MLPTLGTYFGISFYTYPLMMGLAWGFAYQMGRYVLEKSLSPLMWNIFFGGVFLSAWFGAKILFLLTSHHEEFLTRPNFWLGGGFVFYGGLIAALFFISLFCFFYKKFNWLYLAYLVPVLMFAHALGRVGCFLAGCCYGVGSSFLHDRHPVQLYEAVSLVVLAYFFYRLLRKKGNEILVFALYFISYGTIRFALEFLRDDKIRGFVGLFSTSQIVSLCFVIPAFFLLRIFIRRKNYEL